ncbi:MAG: lipoyl(octanoyl) transferase LipB [Mucinivorans sp.]
MIQVEKIEAGVMPYMKAWALQRECFEAVRQGERPGTLIMVEHPHVYTLGKSGAENNLLVSDEFLARIGATFVHVDRGGDITYHGPGQLVIYPILDLDKMGVSLRDYIYKLEQVIIDTLGQWDIVGGRSAGATGVWLDGRRKIAAIGVRASRGVTMHGAALNVTTDLKYFSHINPCGFTDRGVSSIAAEMQRMGRDKNVDVNSVKEAFCSHFEHYFACEIVTTTNQER